MPFSRLSTDSHSVHRYDTYVLFVRENRPEELVQDLLTAEGCVGA